MPPSPRYGVASADEPDPEPAEAPWPRGEPRGPRPLGQVFQVRSGVPRLRLAAYDWVTVAVVRSGSCLLAVPDTQASLVPVGERSTVTIAPDIRYAIRPESSVTTLAVVCVDQDWLAAVLPTGFDLGSTPFRVTRLDQANAATAYALVDRLARPRAVLTALADLVALLAVACPFLGASSTCGPLPRAPGTALTFPRVRSATPIRAEARWIAKALWDDPARRWTLDELAAMIHLSTAQTRRVFATAYGRSPLTYQTMIRVRLMAELLTTTRLPVSAIGARVGWTSSWASRRFRKATGTAPTQYRRNAAHAATARRAS